MLIYRHWAIMVYSEKLLNIIALMKCEDYHYNMHYNCLYLNKGNNSSVKESILAKRIGYREFMVLIICTKNESNLTNRYCDMVPDGQKVRTDGRNGRMDGRTDDANIISLRLRRGIIYPWVQKWPGPGAFIFYLGFQGNMKKWSCLKPLGLEPWYLAWSII